MRTSIAIACILLAVALVTVGCGEKQKDKAPAPDKGAGAAAVVEQRTCPVMGNPIDKQYFADYEGKRIYFCCPMCKPEFEKDPAKYIAKVDAELKKPGGATEEMPGHEGHGH